MLQKQISIRRTSISGAGGLALLVCSRCSGPRRLIPNSVLRRTLSLTSCHRRGHDIMVVVLSSVPCTLGALRRSVRDIYAGHQWWRRTWRILAAWVTSCPLLSCFYNLNHIEAICFLPICNGTGIDPKSSHSHRGGKRHTQTPFYRPIKVNNL